jgi:predicted alpha-1,2-mannosidase
MAMQKWDARLVGVLAGVALLAARLSAAGTRDFASSFEPGDPQPAWADAVEKGSGIEGLGTGGIPGSAMERVVQVTASGEFPQAGEVKENLLDGDPETKWLTQAATGWVQFRLDAPVALARYVLSSAEDEPERDPKDWTLQGSTDGKTWTTLDAQTGQSFDKRLAPREFPIASPAAYAFYRLDITRNGGAPLTQLGDVHLITAATAAPKPPPLAMTSHIERGPLTSPTAKARVGFTGLHCLAFAGSHKAEGRAYSWNKVFDVDIPVTTTTELSYLLFPVFITGDLGYRSTYVAVDLAFSDGSYLSELGAEDQHLVRLDPRAQGESKTLYVDQWNYKRSPIGRVAAGKTIKRILIAYDNPKGGGPFRGFVDDIRIVASPAPRSAASPADEVVTTRGTQSSGRFSRGNNIPATALPNGFNFWVPMTNAGSTSWLYDYHRSNNADNLPALQAFTVSHEPSPWMGDRQTFQVMPSVAASVPDASRAARALAFRHENEEPRPYYYGVVFENGLRAEIAPADHAALLRFSFPGSDESLVFDNVNNQGGLTLDPAGRSLSAYSDVRSRLSAGATRIFIYAEFDRPVVASGRLPGGGGADVTGYFRFEPGADRAVSMRIATSLISVAQARRNLALEIPPGQSFEAVKQQARRLWDERLRVVEVEGASEDQRVTLYSSLYRLFLYPNSAFENTGDAATPVYEYASPFSPPVAPDTPTQTGARIVKGKVYVNNGFWDTFRTAWPAYALLAPRLAAELIDGFVQQYKDGGWVARWSSPGYADLMAGTSSDVAFADAYVKGITGFDARAAYEAAVKNASVAPSDKAVGRKGLDTSIFLGYTSADNPESTSWALDGYVNDFGIANMARALAEDPATAADEKKRYLEESEYYFARAVGYANLFDPAVGFFRGRAAGGEWRVPAAQYDPRVWGNEYTETDGWNFAFTVPHDGQGLANLQGGREKLAARLDAYFSTPETADADLAGSYGGLIHEMVEARDVRMGQYGHSNQPCHHVIYMYDYAGQPSKAQAKLREVLSRAYLGSEIGQGYLGDEDNGEMSAWYVFGALGLYPLQVGSPYYVIGSPLFTQATVHLEGGKDLVIRARSNAPRNVYVQSLKVNGADYGKVYLPHPLVAGGATLEFEMGPEPSSWGTRPEEAPPSITSGTNSPRPPHDVTGPGRGTARGIGNADVGALFDDTSATRVTFETQRPWVEYHLSDAAEVGFYTLTSADVPGDPQSWVLKGSQDGRSWTVLDERSGEAFAWRRYTRPFKVARPGRYGYYRLEVTASSGGPTTSLAEIELLSK